MVIYRVIGPINLIICATFLVLLFFESAFGICLACMVYNLFHKDKAELCPGGTCAVPVCHEIQQIPVAQVAVLVLFLGVMVGVAQTLTSAAPNAALSLDVTDSPLATETQTATEDDCTPHDWAVKIGHAEMWKLHHNCK